MILLSRPFCSKNQILFIPRHFYIHLIYKKIQYFQILFNIIISKKLSNPQTQYQLITSNNYYQVQLQIKNYTQDLKSMNKKKQQEKPTSSKQLKFCHCKKNIFLSNHSKGYYCCEPFTLSKLSCSQCFNQKKCTQCTVKKSKNKISINKSQAELSLFKIPNISKNSDKQQIINKQQKRNQQKCCICLRDFQKMEVKYFQHFECKKRICYPCLYSMYKVQKQSQNKSNKESKDQKLVMNCCNKVGEPIELYGQMFKKDKCVFCGINSKQKECMFEIQNRFKFCRSCYIIETNREQIVNSVASLLTQISDGIPTHCLYCEDKMNFEYYSKDYSFMKAFNRKLCIKCYNCYGKQYSTTLDLLVGYRAPTVFQILQDKAFSQGKKCKHCQQTLIKSTSLNFMKQSDAKFDLVIWRDNQTYCGICLYFIYQSKREQFNKRQFQPLSLETNLKQFQSIRKSYQNNFTQRCMICSTSSTQENPHKLLLDQNNNQKYCINVPKFLLSLNCCKRCLKQLCQKKIKNLQIIKIKNQIIKRDQKVQYLFQSLRQSDSYLLEGQPSQIFNSKKRQSYIQFWSNKPKTQPQKSKIQNGSSNKFGKEDIKKQVDKKQQQKKKETKVMYTFGQFENNEAVQKRKIQTQQIINQVQHKEQEQEQKFYDLIDGDYQQKRQIEELSRESEIVKTPAIQKKLSVKLKSYQQIMNESIQQNQKIYQKSTQYDLLENGKQENMFNKIKEYMMNPDVMEQVFNLSLKQQVHNYHINNQLSNAKKKDNECKISTCPNKKKDIHNPLSKKKDNSLLLNLGLMCDHCFMLYLLGQLQLEKEIDQIILRQKLTQTRKLSKLLEQEIEVMQQI